MPLAGIFSGLAGSLVGGLSSVFGASAQQRAQNRALDKQIKAQADENQKTREYNLMLAKQQNAWNIEQWNRENAYNAPAAQMQRYIAAGLNPNLIYGQSNTAPQLSGSLSSGAPASPNDMSPIGQKGSSFAAGLQKFGEAMMQIPLYREQVRGAKLSNDEKEIDIWNKDRDKYIRDLLARINGSDEAITELLTSKDFEHSPYSAPEVRKALFQFRQMSASAQDSWLNHQLNSKTFDAQLKALASKYKLDDADARRALSLMPDLLDAEKNELNMRKATKSFGQIVRADDFNFKYFIADLIDVVLNALSK